MVSKKPEEKTEIKDLYKEDAEEIPEDGFLKRNAIINALINNHGKSMLDHSREYTDLLKEYIENSKKTSVQKKLFKSVFFWVSVSTLCLSFLLFAGICIYFSLQDFSEIDIEGISGLISSLIGLLSLYIIIPKIIAKYLFNVKEDKHMAKIVKSVQKYDAKVFENLNLSTFDNKKEEEESAKTFMSDLKNAIKEVDAGTNTQSDATDTKTSKEK